MSFTEIMASWGMVAAYVLLNSYGALAIKYRVNALGKMEFSSVSASVQYLVAVATSPLVITGLLAIFLSAVAWIVALSRMEVSVAYPVAVGLNFLVVVSVGIGLYHEALTLSKMLGVGMIFASLVLISRG